MLNAKPKEPPEMPERKPGEPKPGEAPKGPQPKRPMPIAKPHPKPAPMPAIVKQHFIEKPGYVNYYFNQLNRDRVWKALVAGGDFAAVQGPWTLAGVTGMAEEVKFELSDKLASIKLPSRRIEDRARWRAGRTARSARQRRIAGCRLACGGDCWSLGPEKFGEVTYLGHRAARKVATRLIDVLVATYRDVECHFLFDPADGQLAAMEMTPRG